MVIATMTPGVSGWRGPGAGGGWGSGPFIIGIA